MTTAADAIRIHLVAQAGVTAVIGGRLYADILPPASRTSYPAATYQVIYQSSDLETGGSNNFGLTTIQIDCYAKSRKEADQAAEAIRVELEGLSPQILSSVWIAEVAIDTGRNYVEDSQTADPSDTIYVASRDYEIFHQLPATNT